MTREEADFIGGMNMCDEISNEAYKKIMCHCEEQEPCEDAVSRQAAIDACLSGWNKDYKEIVEEIRTLPPVTPKPKMGRWIDKDGISDFMYCSNCGGKKHYSEKWIGCPYCLADMRESYKAESEDKRNEQN